jgi:hypothetical protein
MRFLFVSAFVWVGLFGVFSSPILAAPLKVYILAGQSNMQGHAKVTTFNSMGKDPATASLLKKMLNAEGTPRTCDRVWISSIGSAPQEKHGRLTAGYGAEAAGPKIGPEFTFGITMETLLDEPILIIKTAWGGKSLHTDFRPPSAGTYTLNTFQKEQYEKRGVDLREKQAEIDQASGHYYRLMIEHVRAVLKDVNRVCPEYLADQGYELAGFVWFQGWNDMVDSSVYPVRGQRGGYDAYSECLSHFIRDVRKDLSAPKMKFVIGVMGVGGPLKEYKNERYKTIHGNFRIAMAAPASRREFQGNVSVVMTEKYWDSELGELDERWGKVSAQSRKLNKDKDLSRADRERMLTQFKMDLFTPEELKVREEAISNAAYHYLGAAKIMAPIGQAFAEAVND